MPYLSGTRQPLGLATYGFLLAISLWIAISLLMRRNQQSFFELPPIHTSRKTHGGSDSRGKRKIRRPLAIKKSHHVTLRAQKAIGVRALIKHSPLVHHVLNKASRHFKVKIYRLAIHWNHLHLSVKGSSREGLQNFFRVVAGHIAQEILRQHPLKENVGTARHPQKKTRQFWDDLIFSRIVEWGRDFKNVCRYILKNTLEAAGLITTAGLINYQPRKKRLNTS